MEVTYPGRHKSYAVSRTYILSVLVCGLERGQSQRLLLGDWMPLIHGHSEKSFGSCIPDTLPMLLSGRLPAALQFLLLLKQDSAGSLSTWHVQIPGKIVTELSVRRFDHQETGGDLEGARVPPG